MGMAERKKGLAARIARRIGDRRLLKSAKKKYASLLASLGAIGDGGAAVAFSGGADSTLLLHAAHEALGERCIAVTARSVFIPAEEAADAAELSAQIGAQHFFLDVDVLQVPGVAENPPERCYFCKRALLGAVKDSAARRGYGCVVEGGNADDADDFRPGARAVKELGVRSPLAEAGLTKPEIRALSRAFGLPTADKPSAACLASRFAYGETLTAEWLERVGEAERCLRTLGLTQFRVRTAGGDARIEALPAEFSTVMAHSAEIEARLRALGFRFVSLDLGGYKTGSMNRGLDTGKATKG